MYCQQILYAHKEHLYEEQMISQHSDSESIVYTTVVGRECPFTEKEVAQILRQEIIRYRIRPIALKDSGIGNILILATDISCIETNTITSIHVRTDIGIWYDEYFIFLGEPEVTHAVKGRRSDKGFIIRDIQDGISAKLAIFIESHM
jgi:hypothetical protein